MIMRFRHSGFECMTRKTDMGIPCGYVGIPESHPYHGRHYNTIEDIEVHGGLTFSGYWQGIERILWWLGFDCGHAWDIDNLPYTVPTPPYVFKSNKSQEYVEAETRSLAEQLAKVKTK
jgi:hypothetical protein